MSDIVLAIGTSHSPLLNSPAEDYPKHAAIDASGRKLLDRQGRPCTYGELLEKADPTIKDQIRPEVLQQRAARCTANIEKLSRALADSRLDALIVIGGEDTLGVARRLDGDGVRVVGVPKTIDNDLSGTDFTFGFHTAVQIATDAIDRLHTTAESHNRILVVEVMGRTAGWLFPFGATSAAHTLAMNAQRHFHRYGTTKETLGWIALNQRANAELNPTAVYRTPMTMDDYLNARPITTPFGLYDCDVPCDGAIAVVVSAVDAAREPGLDRVLGVRHQAEHVAVFVADAGYVVEGAVRARVARRAVGPDPFAAVGLAVAQHDLAIPLHAGERAGVDPVVALVVLDHDAQHVAGLGRLGEGRAGVLDAQVDVAAHELEAHVANERARQQVRLAQDLKAVADAHDEAAARGEVGDRPHDGTEAGDRPASR